MHFNFGILMQERRYLMSGERIFRSLRGSGIFKESLRRQMQVRFPAHYLPRFQHQHAPLYQSAYLNAIENRLGRINLALHPEFKTVLGKNETAVIWFYEILSYSKHIKQIKQGSLDQFAASVLGSNNEKIDMDAFKYSINSFWQTLLEQAADDNRADEYDNSLTPG